MGSRSRLEVVQKITSTAFAGLDVNSETNKTDHRSGTLFHLDATVAEHLLLFGGAVGVAATGFYYRHTRGDSGSGAILGDSRAIPSGLAGAFLYH